MNIIYILAWVVVLLGHIQSVSSKETTGKSKSKSGTRRVVVVDGKARKTDRTADLTQCTDTLTFYEEVLSDDEHANYFNEELGLFVMTDVRIMC